MKDIKTEAYIIFDDPIHVRNLHIFLNHILKTQCFLPLESNLSLSREIRERLRISISKKGGKEKPEISHLLLPSASREQSKVGY